MASHILVASFIVVGLVLVLAGGVLGWRWVRNPWFRFAHLAAIGIVVLQAWLGRICPLTTWEMALRARAGKESYTGSFIGHWMEELLYWRAPPWVFLVVYTLLGIAVVWSWYRVRPRPFRRRNRPRS